MRTGRFERGSRLVLTSVVATCFAWVMLCVVAREFSIVRVLAALGACASFAACASLFNARVLLPYLRALERFDRTLLLASVALASVLCLPAFNSHLEVQRSSQIEVRALGERSVLSSGSEVWVRGVRTSSGAPAFGFQVEFEPGEWERRGDAWLCVDPHGASIRFKGPIASGTSVEFVRHSWSGRAEVLVHGTSTTVDLYAAHPGSLLLDISEDSEHVAERVASHLARFVVAAYLLSATAIGILLTLVRAQRRHRIDAARMLGFTGFTLSFLVFGQYLLAFWPGFMTADSLSQYHQAMTGTFDDHHPFPHTLMLWLATRATASPGLYVTLQIIAISSIVGFAVSELYRWGTRASILIVLAVLFALYPPNAIMAITIWKDVTYSYALLFVAFVIARLIRTGIDAPLARGMHLSLVGGLCTVALARHNGIPVVAVLAMVLILSFRGQRRRAIALCAGATLAAVVLVKGPVSRLLAVAPMSGAAASSLQLHQLAAIAAHDPAAFDGAERAVIAQAYPFSRLRAKYTCLSVDPILYDQELNRRFFETDGADAFAELWRREASAHPAIVLAHLECASSHVWRIFPPSRWQFLFNATIDPNAYGLETRPLLPALHRWLEPRLLQLRSPGERWYLWRGALFTYLAIGCFAVGAWRRRDARVLLIAVPVLLNAGLWLIVSVAQDFRYSYPAIALALLSPAMLFVERARARTSDPSPRTEITSTSNA